MKCANCGAEILDTDQFCSKCGMKAVRERRCPDCGTVLREGTKFCHKCGRLVEGGEPEKTTRDDTLDIPIDVIEKNILSETEAEMSSARERMRDQAREEQRRKKQAAEPVRKEAPKPARPARAPKATVYEEPEDDYEEDYDDSYEDYDDYEDYEEEGRGGVDVMTIMTAVVGCVILILAVFLGYHFYRQYVPKNYEQGAEQVSEETGDEEEEEGGADAEKTANGSVTVVSNVNVRDNPDTKNSNVLKVAKAGETYECVGEAGDGNWYEIVLEDGTTGYVYKDYVNKE